VSAETSFIDENIQQQCSRNCELENARKS